MRVRVGGAANLESVLPYSIPSCQRQNKLDRPRGDSLQDCPKLPRFVPAKQQDWPSSELFNPYRSCKKQGFACARGNYSKISVKLRRLKGGMCQHYRRKWPDVLPTSRLCTKDCVLAPPVVVVWAMPGKVDEGVLISSA